MKRLSILFLAIMAVTMISAQNRNARHSSKPHTSVKQTQNVPQGKCGPNLRWKFTKSTGTLEISGTGAMNDFLDDNGPAPWNKYSSNITNVILNGGITKIGNFAFYNYDGLTSVTIPNSVTKICDEAFCGCSGLTSLTIPNSVKHIGIGAFYECFGLIFINIPDSVTKIEADAFGQCSSLKSITIPSSVKEIDVRAFGGCTKLRIKVPRSANYKDDSFEDCNSVEFY